jgi:phosphatidylserine/phosphatidylglycerophosphate/cardiolipin synthase-like enzyme
MAAMLAAGEHVKRALLEVNASRREHVRELMATAGLGHQEADMAVAVLRGIAGAKAVQRDLTPVWTMPGNEADIGHLTSQFHSLVQGARQAVTCATYNFEPTSQMWKVLRDASEQPGVHVTVYVDGDKADAEKVKGQMPKATVFRSGTLPSGKQVVSHAKFVIIDHSVMLLTSANFSYSAENRNIEFGVLINDQGLAESVENLMFSKHGILYEVV